MRDQVKAAIAQLDIASLQMARAREAITKLWNAPGCGGTPLTLDEIKACRRAGARARKAAGGWRRYDVAEFHRLSLIANGAKP